jgi:hypothetical protein
MDKPKIEFFRSIPSHESAVTGGEPVLLEWKVSGTAVSVYLDGLLVGMEGTRTVQPTEDRTYTLRAENPVGYEEEHIPLRVACNAPKIVYFEASSGKIEKNKSVTLAWRVEGADSVLLDGRERPKSEVEVGSVSSGNLVETTTFVLTAYPACSDPAAVATDRVKVEVVLPESAVCDKGTNTKVEIYSSVGSQPIDPGEWVLIGWAVSGATEVYFDGAGVRDTGSVHVSPDETTTYVVTARNHCTGKADAEKVEVKVNAPTPTPAPSNTPSPTPTPILPPCDSPKIRGFWASRERVLRGTMATLFWEVEGASQVWLNGEAVPSDGQKSIALEAEGGHPFKLEAQRKETWCEPEEVDKTRTITVVAPASAEVCPPPSIYLFDVSAPWKGTDDLPYVTVHWWVGGVISPTIAYLNGVQVENASTAEVEPYLVLSTTLFELVAQVTCTGAGQAGKDIVSRAVRSHLVELPADWSDVLLGPPTPSAWQVILAPPATTAVPRTEVDASLPTSTAVLVATPTVTPTPTVASMPTMTATPAPDVDVPQVAMRVETVVPVAQHLVHAASEPGSVSSGGTFRTETPSLGSPLLWALGFLGLFLVLAQFRARQ